MKKQIDIYVPKVEARDLRIVLEYVHLKDIWTTPEYYTEWRKIEPRKINLKK